MQIMRTYGLYIGYNDSEYKKVYDNTITNISGIRGSGNRIVQL